MRVKAQSRKKKQIHALAEKVSCFKQLTLQISDADKSAPALYRAAKTCHKIVPELRIDTVPGYLHEEAVGGGLLVAGVDHLEFDVKACVTEIPEEIKLGIL